MCGDVAKWYAYKLIVIRIVHIHKWLGSEILVYIYLYLIEIRHFRGSYSFIFNNSTGKQFLLSQAFTNFHNLRRQGEVYWQKGFDIQSRRFAFASAPKLPKNAHKLDGLLAGYTSEVLDSLRTQDFQARQLLHGLLMSHELLKFQENIAHQSIPSCKEPCVKDISRVIGSGSLPLLQTLISNQVLVAKQVRLQLRTKAASSVRTHSVRVSLIDGSLFSAGLFDQAAIAKAEDCLRHTPHTVVVQLPSFRSSGNPRQHTPSYNRDGPARSSFHRYKGKGSQYQCRSAPVYFPTRQGKASSGKNKGFANKGKGRQQNFRSQQQQQQGPSGRSQKQWLTSPSTTPPRLPPLVLHLSNDPTHHHQGADMEMVQKKNQNSPSPPTPLVEASWPPTSNRDHPQSPTSALLRQSSVPCSKILRRTEGYYWSLPPKQAHPLPHVSHAGRNKTSKLHPSSLLFHLNRPVRSIPSHSDPPQVSKVPFLFPQQQSLFLSSNAFRNKPRTENIHQSHHRSTQAPASSEYPCISLHRRFPPLEHVRLHACSSDQDSYNSSHQSRSFGQLGKIFPDSSTTNHLSSGMMVRRKPLLPSRPNIDKSLSLISRICQSSTISKKLHQRLLGTLNFLAAYLAQGKLRLIILHAPSFKRKLRVPIPPQWRNHLLWWLDEKNLSQPAPISLPPPTVTFWTDASHSGWWGVSSLGPSALGCWTPEEKLLHINILECLAVLRSLLALQVTTAKPVFHPNPLGQHGRCIPNQQAGLQQKQVPDQSTALPPPTLRESPLALNVASHSGTPELLSRLPLQGSPHQSGIGTQPTVLQTTSQPRSSPDRPLCPPRQRKTPSLRVPLQSPGGDSNRLPLLELDLLGSNLPLLTPLSAPSLPSQAGNLT